MRISIGKQIIMTCSAIIVGFILMDTYMYYNFKSIEHDYKIMVRESTQFTGTVKDIRAELWLRNTNIRNYILTGDPKYQQMSTNSQQVINGKVQELETAMTSPQAQKEIGILKLALAEYNKILSMGSDMRDKLGIEATLKFLTASGERSAAIAEIIDDFVLYVGHETNSKIADLEVGQQRMIMIIIALNVILLTFTLVISFWLARRIARPLASMAQVTSRIAGGDLRKHEISYCGNDEIGDMAYAVGNMIDGLRDIIHHVVVTTEHVAAASEQFNRVSEQSAQAAGQIAEATTNVALGASDQTEEVGHVVETVQEMVTAISNVADNASRVSIKSTETAQIAMRGSVAVDDACNQMQVINHSVSKSSQMIQELGISSRQIGEIVHVISNIAGQTNLLALNAAIEAARAGEHGRGFAVVAEEVKKLANQSQEAAKTISDIIQEIHCKIDSAVEMMEDGNKDVHRGTEVMSDTGVQFGNIVRLIQELDGQIREISGDVERVTSFKGKVFNSIGQVKELAKNTQSESLTISAATEEQLASMEEVSSSARQLADKADSLKEMVSKFQL
ncbi:methyl-accepting chemotaxis protein [Pelosinus sp. sgz500959]|uniref:methyl-accepting chemotaxis protein n=1 Tax=Pelosinus sp. sgz500959 TaxID=3242472 RepID=UPI00366C9BE7